MTSDLIKKASELLQRSYVDPENSACSFCWAEVEWLPRERRFRHEAVRHEQSCVYAEWLRQAKVES